MMFAFSQRFIRLIGILVVALVPAAATASGTPVIQGLGPHDALMVMSPAGETVFTHQPDRPLVPASTLKVLTSLLALHYLGPDYRFPTDFYVDDRNNLIIKGYGDPLLISEVIAGTVPDLAAKLAEPIQDILLDETFFAEPLTIPGVSSSTNPYDAPNGALCANFNTVCFARVDGRIQSAEPQTPLLPMVVDRIRRSGLREGRIVLSRRNHEALLYTGNLFRYFLEQEGAVIRGVVRKPAAGEARGPEARRIHRHLSPQDLRDVIRSLLQFSNNFTANQLLLTVGAHRYGAPTTLDKGVQALRAYAQEQLGLRSGVFVEGSGISRGNRLSVRDMMVVLAYFRPHARLMPRKGNEFYKTGTLNGVRTRAGYIEAAPGEFYRFALFRNGTGKSTDPVMRQIHRYLAAKHP